MEEAYLFQIGYEKAEDNLYKKVNEKSGMTIKLRFNPKGDIETNKEIENNIIKLLTRQD